MNWYLFGSVAVIVFLCGAHAMFAKQFKDMRELGLDVEVDNNPVLRASGILMPLVNFNLLAFLVVLGISQGWSIALLTVLGGAATAYALAFVLIKTNSYLQHLSGWHKSSWITLPLLSVAIWLILYGVIPLD